MHRYRCSNPTIFTYAALHGTYGLLWLLKDYVYPDAGWGQKKNIVGAATTASILGGYWVAPYLIASQRIQRPPKALAIAVGVHTVGVMITFVTDAQRYYTILARKRTLPPTSMAILTGDQGQNPLITDGFFAFSRNMNYFGEMLMYGSYAYIADRVEPWLVLAFVWLVAFNNFISEKEESNARKRGWPEYSRTTSRLIPFFPLSA